MKIKAIVTALVLATSTAAMAAPTYAPQIRDHRGPAREAELARPRPFESWSLLGYGQLVRGKASLAVTTTGKVDKLKLEATRGMFFLDKVIVTFGNGRSQTIEVNQWVSARDGAVVDLAGRGRKIAAVHVIGRGNGFRAGASFKLLALG